MTENKEEVKSEHKTEVPVSFEQMIENEIKAKGVDAPRVTKEHVDALFKQIKIIIGQITETRILATAYLDGFAIADGFSSPIDPKNFDEQIGIKLAQKKCATAAYDKLWELEGYRLSRSLVEQKQSQSNEPAEQAVS